MDRRAFIRTSVLTGGATALGPDFWRRAWAVPVSEATGPYGPLGEPDANGIRLPEGFRSRVLARAGEPVAGTDHVWHTLPDGGATFPADDGDGWIYVSNSEVGNWQGGVGALRFDADGEVVDAYPILTGTSRNCAGGPTPWSTWLSCEEFDLHGTSGATAQPRIAGEVWECDPQAPGEGVARPALGRFQHEAAAVDPDGQRIYLTEDIGDGNLYRFTPTAYPDLSDGVLEVARFETSDQLAWEPVPDPGAASAPTRRQVPDAAVFDGGEGAWFDQGVVYVTTKGDDRVHAIETATDRYEVIYDGVASGGPLRGVDNLTVEVGSGDLYVAEDSNDMQIVLLTPERTVAPFLEITGHSGSEVTGPCFDPSGGRLYFSSQRGGGGGGITYEVEGPFRGPELVGTGDPPTTATTLGGATERAASDGDDPGGDAVPYAVGGVAVAALAAGGIVWRLRTRGD